MGGGRKCPPSLAEASFLICCRPIRFMSLARGVSDWLQPAGICVYTGFLFIFKCVLISSYSTLGCIKGVSVTCDALLFTITIVAFISVTLCLAGILTSKAGWQDDGETFQLAVLLPHIYLFI